MEIGFFAISSSVDCNVVLKLTSARVKQVKAAAAAIFLFD